MNADFLLDGVVVGLHARTQSDVHPEGALLRTADRLVKSWKSIAG